ncbi:oligosaccharide flippase family protein [Vibrio sp. STUT-A11]|uniref:oligosaccharide flippase family protein n=1 Tax=Vibrio sp. STUT-A11 TaxID=2976236 RepID=UPI00222FB363|nr:oligosaccharide flippase family protein [Vibrio sp. STUT-A11]
MFKLNLSDFSLGFVKLLSTGVLTAAITALSLPIIARLYSPEELGTYQLFISIVLVFSSVSSFKYELAIVLPRRRYQSLIVIRIALLSTFISTIMYGLIFYFFSEIVLSYFNATELLVVAWMIPIGVGLNGLVQMLQMCLVYKGDFSQLSYNKGSQAIINNGMNIGLGQYNASFTTLIVSYISSNLFIILMASARCKHLLNSRRSLSFSLLFRYAKKYGKFPTLNTTNTILNNVSINLPVFVLSRHFNMEVVGIYMMANRLLDMPISLVSGALSQVFTKFAADDYKISPDQLKNRYLNTLKKLAIVSIVFILGVGLLSLVGVDILLGDEWEKVNTIMLILGLSKCAQLMNSPLASTLSIVNRQEIGLMLLFIFLPIRYISLTFSDDLFNTLFMYSIATMIFYFTYNLFMYKSIK